MGGSLSGGGCRPCGALGGARTRDAEQEAAASAAVALRQKTFSVCRRLRKLEELDEHTRVPFILVELRGHGPRDGYIEVCGKDEYGVYESLDSWLRNTWKCTRLDAGNLDGDVGRVPFCDALYRWEGFLTQDSDGVSNMGLATMQLVDLMCRQLSWTLGVINGGNVGAGGSIREQQVIFKAPHPMNLVVPHLMVELRAVGSFSLSLSGDPGAMDALHEHWTANFGARRTSGHGAFCGRHYECQGDIFKARGGEGENNIGWLTTKVCDDIVNLLPGWSLVTMSGGNYGQDGACREQQLIFRQDDHPLGKAPHYLVELREAGFVQESGQNVDGIQERLEQWLMENWHCDGQGISPSMTRRSKYYDCKHSWKSPKDLMAASADITAFFHKLGWQMQACSQGTVDIQGHQSQERQLLFRPRSSRLGRVEPHLFLELYTGDSEEELSTQPDVVHAPRNQRISICQVGDCGTASKQLRKFIGDYLGGSPKSEGGAVLSYKCQIFLSRGTENNLGLWTMRICDFMVDRLGWSFAVCSVCNLGASRHVRQQQLVFRFDGERPEIPLAKPHRAPKAELFRDLQFPSYWRIPEVLNLKKPVGIIPCVREEVLALQDIFDATFKRVNPQEEACRLQVVHAFRSEHAELYRRFVERRASYAGGPRARTRTGLAGGLLNGRLLEGEALLAHGTNPSSAMGILRTGFRLTNAGKTTGMLYGHGIYLAECVSQSDRYSCDDSGGNYPELRAMLLCRCLVGRPYVVQESGDHVRQAKASGCDCIVGDRESKLGLFREYIFFDERQVLPEYAVIYQRQYDPSQLPLSMRWPLSTCKSAAKQAAAKLRNLQCVNPAGFVEQ